MDLERAAELDTKIAKLRKKRDSKTQSVKNINENLALLEAQAKALRVPPEPVNRGKVTVITFVKRFGHPRPIWGNSAGGDYTFAAIRPPGMHGWAVSTSKAPNKNLTWDQLVRFITSEGDHAALDTVIVWAPGMTLLEHDTAALEGRLPR